MTIQPYLIVPKLIPQPTWGGDYIANLKGIRDATITSQKIGQSYELGSDSMLTTDSQSERVPIEIGDPKDGHTVDVVGDRAKLFALQKLIDENPMMVLGSRALERHGAKMNVLIKFTQAKGNSFQVHVRPGNEFGHWLPKPESWYFFEQGRATLGLANPTDDRVQDYKRVCAEIAGQAQLLQEKTKKQEIGVEEARATLAELIKTLDPFGYVNVLDIPKDSVVDLSAGGIHHSWEEGESIPKGNVVYEVQVNVMDDKCTLRSFDKGKMSDDGSVRPVHVDAYFQALDTDPGRNAATQLISTPQHGKTSTKLFGTPYYTTELIEFEKEHVLSETKQESFKHVFVKEGHVHIHSSTTTITASAGSSVFVPASVQSLSLVANGRSVVLVTTV